MQYSIKKKDDKNAPPPLDEGDISLLKSYGLGPYATKIKEVKAEIKKHQQTVKDLIGIKESDTPKLLTASNAVLVITL